MIVLGHIFIAIQRRKQTISGGQRHVAYALQEPFKELECLKAQIVLNH